MYLCMYVFLMMYLHICSKDCFFIWQQKLVLHLYLNVWGEEKEMWIIIQWYPENNKKYLKQYEIILCLPGKVTDKEALYVSLVEMFSLCGPAVNMMDILDPQHESLSPV